MVPRRHQVSQAPSGPWLISDQGPNVESQFLLIYASHAQHLNALKAADRWKNKSHSDRLVKGEQPEGWDLSLERAYLT